MFLWVSGGFFGVSSGLMFAFGVLSLGFGRGWESSRFGDKGLGVRGLGLRVQGQGFRV